MNKAKKEALKEKKGWTFSGSLETSQEEIARIAECGSIDDKKKLVDLLDYDSPGIVESAQNAIAGMVSGKKELIKKLMDVSASSSFSIKAKSNSFDTLKQIAAKNGNFIVDYAGKNKGKYDRVAAEIMRYGNFTPGDYPKKALMELAVSGDEVTRANAIESAGILKIDLGKILLRSLNDCFFVLSAAVFSIGELKLKSALPKLKEMLLNSRDRVVKNIILESISKIGGEDTTDFLLYLLNNNSRLKLDKIYILKNLYKICLANSCDKKSGTVKNSDADAVKKKLYLKLSGMNLKISIFSLVDYEEKDAMDAILCYFSLLNHKKSVKVFKFILEFYRKNENIDEAEYGYIKNIIKKIARPKYIVDYIKSLKPSSESAEEMNLLIDVLSEISQRDIINLLRIYKDKKLFVGIKLALLKYSERLSVNGLERQLLEIIINSYLRDGNGDVRKYSVNLLANFGGGALYIERIFNGLLKENYQDVVDAYISAISEILGRNRRNKKYVRFFIGNLALKNVKTVEYSLRILGDKKPELSVGEMSDLYSKLKGFKGVKSMPLKRLLAKAVKNFDLINHKEDMSFLLGENDEKVKFNYLESLFACGEKNTSIFLDSLRSGEFSEMFRYKIVELIQQLKDRKSFDGLALLLRKEKSKMVKVALLRALHNIDKEKSGSILKKYKLSKDEDLRNFSGELIKN